MAYYKAIRLDAYAKTKLWNDSNIPVCLQQHMNNNCMWGNNPNCISAVVRCTFWLIYCNHQTESV